MAGFDKTVAVDGGMHECAEAGDLPKVLFVRCGIPDSLSPNPGLHDSLSSEGWSVDNCQTGLVSAPIFSGSILGKLLEGLFSKRKFMGGLIRSIRQYDIVHIQTTTRDGLVHLGLPALVLAKFFGRRVVLQLLSAEVENFFEKSVSWYRPILKCADRIVVGSRYLQKVVSRARLSSQRLIHVVDCSQLRHKTVSKLQPMILMNCPLEAEYNIGCALRAFRLVKQKYPRSEMVVAGKGSLGSALRRQVVSEHLHGIEFSGETSEDVLGSLFGKADLFLNTASVIESPASVVTAFAAGLPVVSTDADGLLHMVTDRVNAMVVPVNNHVQLANRIIELIENPVLTSELSNQGKREARKYSWASVRRDWIEFYSDLNS